MLKAFMQLGFTKSLYFLIYQLNLRTGLLFLQSLVFELKPDLAEPIQIPWAIPSRKALKSILGNGAKALIDEADRIIEGSVPLYGAEWRILDLRPGSQQHWTAFTNSLSAGRDIKHVWEMGRFAWATTLARAFHLTSDEKYAEYFWQKFEEFCKHNPPNLGPHWSSAQEVSIRLISLSFSYALIKDAKASSSRRRNLLAASLAAHAGRLPITLSYAQAQDNNHLLSEAAGLITAALALPSSPRAAGWLSQGRQIFTSALHRQIDSQGRYTQQSSNYQRLALQLALWVQLLLSSQDDSLPENVLDKLALATQWQLDLSDKASGHIVNLGPNDGAYLLPLTTKSFADHRPVLQAAIASFLGQKTSPKEKLDEMSIWLASPRSNKRSKSFKSGALRLQGKHSWAYLRAAHFSNRPGHADQLHVDLWWQSINIARDNGSYLYTAPRPWDNALSATRAHNTLTITNRDQMQKAGRFLWLDWAQAQLLEEEYSGNGDRIMARASHNGFRDMNLRHERQVNVNKYDQWEIVDQIISTSNSSPVVNASLFWHLPDLPWRLDDDQLILETELGPVQISVSSPAKTHLRLFKAGELLAGSGKADPIMGWHSATYNQKEPGLSLVVEAQSKAPLKITSRWSFPDA
jgi:hypothetical protein